MSSSVNRRIFRSPEAEEDVVVVGESVRRRLDSDDPIATVTTLLAGANQRVEAIVAEARARAEAIVAEAGAEVAAASDEGRRAGYQAGLEAAEKAAAAHLDTIRIAAADGLSIRAAMIDDAMPTIARAVAMACRRVVGAAFEADPSLAADACSDAVRMAAGQEIISIRVSPAALDTVRTSLVDVASYVIPDEAVEMGGCVIDLHKGTIDATLDSRLELMELALRAAGGTEA